MHCVLQLLAVIAKAAWDAHVRTHTSWKSAHASRRVHEGTVVDTQEAGGQQLVEGELHAVLQRLRLKLWTQSPSV